MREPTALGQLIGRLTGWRRYLVATLMGLVAVAAFPPYGIVPALIPAFALLIWLARSATSKRGAFAVGLAFGVGHFYGGLYWIAHAFAVYGGPSAIVGWPAVGGLSVFLALYPGLVTLLYYKLAAREGSIGLADAALFAALWTLAEWLRGWVFTGFPWNPVGSVWVVSDSMLQVTSLVGVYGLGFLTVLVATAFAGEWWQGYAEKPKGWWRLPAVAVAVLLLVWGGGAYRLADAPMNDNQPDVRLRLVQPNIEQRLKWHPDFRARHVQDQVDISLQPTGELDGGPTHVIWSETAVPFYVNGDEALLSTLARAVPAGGYLLTGGLRREGSGRDTDRFNSLLVIDNVGRIAADYDKVHLVPFGEYMPLGDYLPFDKLTPGRADFAKGEAFTPIAVPGLPPFQPLICYEAIFPADVVSPTAPRPDWLLNITNDAWYGLSIGPYQHFGLVRIRAVEEGLPVVRVANTGVSGVIDSWGRVRTSLDLGQRGFIDAALPKPIEPTAFSKTGNLPVLIVVLLIVCWRWYARNQT